MSKYKICLTILFFVSIVALMAFGACSKSKPTSELVDAQDITVWAWTINVPVLEVAAEEFQMKQPKVKITISDFGSNDVYTKLTTGFQAGGAGLPDVSLIEDNRLQGYLSAFRSQFVNLTEMGFDTLLQSFPKYKQQAVSMDGQSYAFPFDGGPVVVFFRRNVFEQAGIEANRIQTWQDFIEAGMAIKEATGAYMFSVSSDDDGPFRIIMNQLGVYYFDYDGNIDFLNPKVIAAMTLLKQANDAGIIYTGAKGWSLFVQALSNGTIVAIPSGGWLAGTIKGQIPDSAGDWGIFPLPVEESQRGMVAAANQGGSSLALLSASDSIPSAYEYLKMFSTTIPMQVEAFRGGLFPTYLPVYEDTLFQAADEFFGGQAIWQIMADTVRNIPKINYTNDYTVGREEILKAQTEVLFSEADPATVLEAAAQRLANRTGRKINQY